MKNKIFTLIFISVILVSLIYVIAQEAQVDSSTSIDVNTQKEVETMHVGLGAKVRVIQLKVAITRKIFEANIVIDYLKEKGKNTTELEDIVTQLEILKNETDTIKNITNREEAIKKFIDIKKDARSLIADFKTKARAMLTDSDREEIAKRREERKGELENQIKVIRSELDSIKNSFHEEQVKKILEKMNVTDDDLLQKVKNGEITLEELKKELRDKYDSLPDSEKVEVKTRVSTEVEKIRSENELAVKAYLNNVKERVASRLQERAQKLEEKGKERAALALRNTANKIENKSSGSSGSGGGY